MIYGKVLRRIHFLVLILLVYPGLGPAVGVAGLHIPRRLEWFQHGERRNETENIRVLTEMKMEVTRPRGRPRLRCKDTVRSDMEAWKIREEWAIDRERWKCICKIRYLAHGDDSEM